MERAPHAERYGRATPPKDFMKKRKIWSKKKRYGSLISKVARCVRAIFDFQAHKVAKWHGLPVPCGTAVPHKNSAKRPISSSSSSFFPIQAFLFLSLKIPKIPSLSRSISTQTSPKILQFSRIFLNFFNSFISLHFPLKISHLFIPNTAHPVTHFLSLTP